MGYSFFSKIPHRKFYRFINFKPILITLSGFEKMKSKDLQNIVLSKYENGDAPTKISRDLNGGISLVTVKRWCQMIRLTGSIELSDTHGGPRIVRTKENILKMKNRLRRKTGVFARKLSMERRYFCNKCQTNIKSRFRTEAP